jgi:hypothetical protein
MADQQQENLATKAATKLLRLFGPAPVLSSEDRAQFDQVLESLITCFLPKDFMEQTLVWELAIATWEAARIARNKTASVEGKFRERLAHQGKRIKGKAERDKLIAVELAAGEAVNDMERSFVLECISEMGVKAVDAILDRATAEREQAIAFEQTFTYYERLDDRYGVALRRRNELLELFEIYRVGLGQQLRLASDQVIEGDFKEVKTPEIAAPSVTPSAELTS